MELATINEENPCGNRGFHLLCQSLALDGTRDEKWRRRESNPQVESCNSEVAQRLWNMLQDVGVSWEYTDDTNRHLLATEHEELAGLFNWSYRLKRPCVVYNRLWLHTTSAYITRSTIARQVGGSDVSPMVPPRCQQHTSLPVSLRMR